MIAHLQHRTGFFSTGPVSEGPWIEMSLTYPIKLEPDDNGTLLVTCPALPEVTTFGEDEAEAFEHYLLFTRENVSRALSVT